MRARGRGGQRDRVPCTPFTDLPARRLPRHLPKADIPMDNEILIPLLVSFITAAVIGAIYLLIRVFKTSDEDSDAASDAD